MGSNVIVAAAPGITVNHWGKWVNSEIPVTGVIGLGKVSWDHYLENEIPLYCERCPDRRKRINRPCEFCEVTTPALLGSWRKVHGLWQPAPKRRGARYAAIRREDVIQVVWSIATQRGALCSPCYPGQVDLESPGEFLGYCLPES